MRKVIESFDVSSPRIVKVFLSAEGIHIVKSGYKTTSCNYGSNGDASVMVQKLWEFFTGNHNNEPSGYLGTPYKAIIYLDCDRFNITFINGDGSVMYNKEVCTDLSMIMELIAMGCE